MPENLLHAPRLQIYFFTFRQHTLMPALPSSPKSPTFPCKSKMNKDIGIDIFNYIHI